MNIAKKVSLITLLSAGLCAPVAADFVGLNIGVTSWAPDIKGTINSTGSSNSTIQLDNDLGYKDTTSTTLNIRFEHPIPLLPNVKYSGSDLNSSSTSTTPLTFDGKSYTGTINSTLDLSHNDIVLYYELLDNWINVDFGLDLKRFDGKVSMRDSIGTTPSNINVDETIPMLYLAARFDLPLTGLYVGANIQQLSVGDNSAEDTTVMIGYESKMGLGLEGGYRTFTLELDDAKNLNTNLEYNGLFVNGYFHF
ncbi:MAG: TIGR04219 family outer membrane beta-barrel protein [Gammaproteobacteria bacterium]|nr:TIGR04219 family outer membrane beta-barrel protein [Gammaproteobacteria bacterium]